MERNLKLAIARVKRRHNKYDIVSNVLDNIYEYCLSEDEVKVLVEKYNEWIAKNYNHPERVSLEVVLRNACL